MLFQDVCGRWPAPAAGLFNGLKSGGNDGLTNKETMGGGAFIHKRPHLFNLPVFSGSYSARFIRKTVISVLHHLLVQLLSNPHFYPFHF